LSRLVALDPGRSKCGLVLIDSEHNRVLAGKVVPPEAVKAWVDHWHEQHNLDQIIVGDGTSSAQWVQDFNGFANVQSVNEHGTTLRARDRYWALWPAKGWQRLLPKRVKASPPRTGCNRRPRDGRRPPQATLFMVWATPKFLT